MKKKNNTKKEEKKFKIGKLEMSWKTFDIILTVILILSYVLSPRVYSVTTGLYNQGTEQDKIDVDTAMGPQDTEDRFNIYFKWYNVLHELGHGLLYYNNGVKIDIVDEEQLVNDFALAYWKFYGEEDKITELEENIRKIQTDYQNAKAELDTLKIENTTLSDSNSQLKNELESFKTEYEQS